MEYLLKLKRNFIIDSMKNFLKLFILIFLTLLVFNKNSFSCDAIKNVKVGEDFSKSIEILYFIDGYNQDDFDEGVTVEYQSDTDEYCPEMGLENTILKVFIYNSKIAGLRIETWDIEAQENEIYKFVKNFYGDLDEEAKKNNWIGYKDLSIGDNRLFYAKMERHNGLVDGIAESFDITTEQLMDYTVTENIVKMGGE
tara:strand:+ start:80 stop:670 length:591 start_codon:yes stop_codon:yes gene_type:complete